MSKTVESADMSADKSAVDYTLRPQNGQKAVFDDEKTTVSAGKKEETQIYLKNIFQVR